MGASEWFCFMPYQPDAAAALADARERDFRARAYYDFVSHKINQLRRLRYDDYNPYEDHPRYAFSAADLKRWVTLPQPETAEDLVKIQGDSGTHCIIDIDGISLQPEFRRACPLSPAQLVELFGTDRPTRESVEAQRPRLQELITEWMAVYFTVYEAGQPSALLFYGITGD